MKTSLLPLLLVFLFTLSFSSATAQWAWLNPKPSGNTGKSITFINDQTGFIINGSQLLYTTNAGASWGVKQNITSGNEIKFKGNIGFIVGDFGTLYKTEDTGENWQKLTSIINEQLNSVNILHNDTVYITSNKSLLKSVDGGTTWSTATIQAPGISNLTINKSFFINSKVGHVVSNNGLILKTIDGGLSWYRTENKAIFASPLLTIYFINSKVGFTSNSASVMMKTIDGGETWFEIPNTSDDIYDFFFLNENVGYITGEHGVIHKTTNGGASWQWAGFQNGRIDATSMYGIHFTNEFVGYATGMGGRIIKTTDGGSTWTGYSFTYNTIQDLQFPTSKTGYALGSELYKTTDTGENWVTLNTGLDEYTHYYRLAQFFSADTGYVVAREAYYNTDHLLKTTDGGNTWTKHPLHMAGVGIGSIHFLNNRIGYISTGSGFIKTTDGGNTWQRVSSFNYATKMHFINENQGFAIQHGDLYMTTNAGTHWVKTHEVYGDFTDFSFVNDKVGYISAEYNTVLKTINGGDTWQELKTEYDHLKNIAFYNENIGYITGEYGKNFHTSDGGLTWKLISMPSQISSLVITKDKDIFAAGANGKILRNTLTFDEYVLKALPAKEIFSNDALFTIVMASNGEELTDVAIEYGTDMKFGTRVLIPFGTIKPNTSREYIRVFYDLLPETKYYYRVTATYKGTKRVSSPVEFTTLPSFDMNVRFAMGITSDGADLNGQVTSNYAEISNIQFEYATDNSFTEPKRINATPDMVKKKSTAQVAAKLQELKSGTKYFTRLKITYLGKDYYSSPYSFTTKPEYAITVTDPYISGSDVRWSARVESFKTEISNIAFEYGTTRDFGSQATASPDVIPGNQWKSVSATISGLENDRVYYYRVKAMQGDKPIYSTVNLFRASGGVILEPEKVEAVNSTSALLKGIIAPQGSYIYSLKFEYGETEDYGKTINATPNFLYQGATGTVQAEVKNLAPATAYFFRITGVVNGEAYRSSSMKFTTSMPTGIPEEVDRKLAVYPNPVLDQLYLTHQDKMQRIEVYNPLGRVVLAVTPKTLQHTIDLSAYSPGVYYIKIFSNGYTHIRKVVKL